VARYFADLPAMAASRPPAVIRQLADAAYPRYAVSARTVAAADRLLARDDLPEAVRRVVVDQTDDIRRALSVRGAAGR
jgi:aminopeptidase N